MAETSSHIEEDVAPRSVIALKHASNGEAGVEIRYILQNWQYKDVNRKSIENQHHASSLEVNFT